MRGHILDMAPWIGGILLLALLLGGFGLAWLRFAAWRRRSCVMTRLRLPRRMAEPVGAKVTTVFWIVFLSGVGITIYLGVGSGPRPAVPAPRPRWHPGWIGRLGLISLIATTVVPVLARWLRTQGEVGQAMKRAEAGDGDGAIRDLRLAVIAQGPSAERSHALARLMMRKENWIDARKLLLEAEELSADPLRYRHEMAVVLRNLGRSDDARACIEPLVQSRSASLESVCTSCDLLIDLGRLDEACDRIAKAEVLFKELRSTSPSHARRQRPMLDACRARLEAKLPSRKTPGLEE